MEKNANSANSGREDVGIEGAGHGGFDFRLHLQRQADFSLRTFGPGARVKGVTDHIRKELAEVEASGGSLAEWIDVVILGLDGCWRSGASPLEIIHALEAKQTRNENRAWPDWRTVDPNKAIEHDRSGEDVSGSATPPRALRAEIREEREGVIAILQGLVGKHSGWRSHIEAATTDILSLLAQPGEARSAEPEQSPPSPSTIQAQGATGSPARPKTPGYDIFAKMRKLQKENEGWTFYLPDPLGPPGQPRSNICNYCYRPRTEHREDGRCPIKGCTLQGPPADRHAPDISGEKEKEG